MNLLYKKVLLVLISLFLILEGASIHVIKANSGSSLPITSIQFIGYKDINGTYYGNVQFVLSAIDNDGISTIQYKLSSSNNWTTYTQAVTLTPGKAYEISYRSIDIHGNMEQEKSSVIIIKKDTRPPSSSATISEQPIHGFFNKAISVNLSATDLHSGVNRIEYSLDNGSTWLNYSIPITISKDGQTILYHRAIDNSGNMEKIQRQKINIDVVAPNEPLILLDSAEWTNGERTISISDGEDEGSGSKGSQYRIGESEWTDYVLPFTISSVETIQARTVDFAGNWSNISESHAKIDVTSPPEPILNIPDWSDEPVFVDILKVEDDESGVKVIQYQIGSNQDWLVYYEPFSVEIEGVTSVRARSIDWAGNIGEIAEDFAKIDQSPPSKPSISLSHFSWTNQDVVFSINHGLDLLSGVQKSQYKIGAGEWIDYTVPVTVEEEGIQSVYARTIDNVDNISEEAIAEVKIDRTPPQPPLVSIKRGGLSWFKNSNFNYYLDQAKVTIMEGKDNISSTITRTQYKIGNGEWINYDGMEFTVKSSSSIASGTIYARSIDLAGNISNSDIFFFPIITVKSFQNLNYIEASGFLAKTFYHILPTDGQLQGISGYSYRNDLITFRYSYKKPNDNTLYYSWWEFNLNDIHNNREWMKDFPSPPNNIKLDSKTYTT